MSSIKTLNRKRGNILAQLTKLSSKPLDNLSEFELRTTLDLSYGIKVKFEDIKQAYFEIDNDKEFKDVEPILNKIDEDIQDFQNQIRISKEILLQNTYFGYLVTGSVQSNPNKISCHLSVVGTHLDDTLRSFWEIKALPEKTLVDTKLKYCMEHFDATHTRDSNGRYVVQMPIIKDKVQLGSSKVLMVKGLNSTLIRLNRSPDVKKLYNDFYVDDVLSSAPDLETAIEIQLQLVGMMNAGGMHQYKWCSNSRHLLSKVSTDDQEYVVGNDDHTSRKALELSWNPKRDSFLRSDVDFTNNWDCSNTDPVFI
ncbi:integrase catalytic domain-containing protein [Trichonephila clavata]|uniref:Integrase catalytic domain-containing protein n=1 Tax=Trichonephila clavata TaxID=2740835 RepID=A0A8X6FAS6_TRICU|nr:integrase catalytic domain-containing protein [Trichonephila clavata]